MAWIITNPPQSLRLLSRTGLWVNLECEKCRRVRSLRPFEIDRILAARGGEDTTLDDLRQKGKCAKEGCDGRPKRLEAVEPSPAPDAKHVSWDEYRLLKAMQAERF